MWSEKWVTCPALQHQQDLDRETFGYFTLRIASHYTPIATAIEE